MDRASSSSRIGSDGGIWGQRPLLALLDPEGGIGIGRHEERHELRECGSESTLPPLEDGLVHQGLAEHPSSFRAATDIDVLTSSFSIPGFGLILINTFVLRGPEPSLVDGGQQWRATSS